MNVLNVQRLSMSFGAHDIFDDADFAVDVGEKVALVGANGVGKTTLMRILVGELEADAAEIAWRKDARVGYLAQKPQIDPAQTARSVVAEAVQPVRDAIARFEAMSASIEDADDLDAAIARQEALRHRIEELGGWDWQRRVDETLERLGLSTHLDEPIGRLSGGQRRRVGLARVLIASPDLLLLDEPTNHLDHATVEWLEGWLRGFGGAVAVISHDRYFLERVAERIIEVAPDGIHSHPGSFADYMERRRHRLEVRKKTVERRDKLLADELDWLERGVKARGRASKSRADQVRQAREQQEMVDDQKIDITLSSGDPLGAQVVSALGIYKSYGDRLVLEDASLTIAPGDKIGLVGPNGCGKSTFLDILVGRLRFDAGQIERSPNVEIGYLSQSGHDFDRDRTVYEAFSESDYVWIGDERHHKRDYLGRFGFDRHLVKRLVGVLSGGQLRRLRLAHVIAENANLLVLDEPTNDLDLDSLDALEEALAAYKGCIVTVSHDRYFLNRICNSIVAFEDGQWRRYWGDWDDYKAARQAEIDAARADAPARPSPAPKAAPAAEPAPKQRDGLSWKEERRLEALEDEIGAAEDHKAELEAALADPDLYASRTDEIAGLNAELAEASDALEALYREWAALESRRT